MCNVNFGKMEVKIVRIKTAGCDIYPHGSYHKVLDLKDGVYPTLNESDRIPEEWCEEGSLAEFIMKGIPIFGVGTARDKGIFGLIGYNLNEFRRFGYNSDGSKTWFFISEEYESFEQYMKDNNLSFE